MKNHLITDILTGVEKHVEKQGTFVHYLWGESIEVPQKIGVGALLFPFKKKKIANYNTCTYNILYFTHITSHLILLTTL